MLVCFPFSWYWLRVRSQENTALFFVLRPGRCFLSRERNFWLYGHNLEIKVDSLSPLEKRQKPKMPSLQRDMSFREGVARGQSLACILACGCCRSALNIADSRVWRSHSTGFSSAFSSWVALGKLFNSTKV